MYRTVLAPLDGSELAECTLAHLTEIACKCEVSDVILFEVVEPLSAQTVAALAMAGKDLLRKAELANQRKAKAYLNGIAARLQKDGIAARVVISDGDPATEILAFLESNQIDLVIMSTHGRTGAVHWFLGSVVERVVRHSKVPVLTISPPGCTVS